MTSLSAVRPVGLPPTLQRAPSNAAEPTRELEREIRQVLGWADLILDDWQESFLFDALRTQPDGRWASFEVAGVMPRQNGKGTIQEARQLVGLFVLGERLQIHTAHEFKTCSEHFWRVKGLIEGSDELMQQVRIIRTGAGEQSVELYTGERLRFLARSRKSIRGFSADVIYFDEAFELPIETVGSVLPTMSARPNPQSWYLSSAPHFTSDFLHSLLRRAESDDPGSLFLRAWESDPDTQHDDVEAWRRVNPALGIRIDEEFVRNEMRTLCETPEGIAEFARERLGIREGGDGEAGVIPYDKWVELGDRGSTVRTSLSYGLSVSPDGQWSSFASAGRRPDGLVHVDTVDRRPGTAWVVDRAKELGASRRVPVRVNPAAAEGALIRALRDARVDVVEVDGRQYQQACGAFLLAVENGALRHLDQESMNRSVAAAGRRDVGHEGAWVWVRPGAVDISPLTAATNALTGVEERRPPRIHVLAKGGGPT